ncbi:MAG: 2-oxoglutarate and iron-dependent oxygenase domain-containing protein [Pseudomonadota bacterium]
MTPQLNIAELSLEEYVGGDVTGRHAFGQDLFNGLKQFGFIILRDHGVSTELLDEAYALAAEFFSLTDEEKCRYVVGTDGQRGYTAFGREHAKDADVGDLKEFWHVGRDGEGLTRPNIWPNKPQAFKDIYSRLYTALERVGDVMLEALAPVLGEDAKYFSRMTEGGDSILRLLHYPPIPATADPRAVRAAAHEDINLITLLVAANGAGLQLLTREGEWLPVNAPADRIIVDAGDMLARITSNVIPATTHRVINPEGPNVSRYSMPFFMHARADAVLSCLDSCKGKGEEGEAAPDITAGAFLQERLAAIGLA